MAGACPQAKRNRGDQKDPWTAVFLGCREVRAPYCEDKVSVNTSNQAKHGVTLMCKPLLYSRKQLMTEHPSIYLPNLSTDIRIGSMH